MLEFGLIFRRIAAALLAFALFSPLPAGGEAPPPARPARLGADAIGIERSLFGQRLAIEIALPAPAPFRVFTLSGPARLVVDLEGVDAAGLDPAGIARPRSVARVAAAPARPGWARLVFELARPFAVETAALAPSGTEPPALRIALRRASAEEFAAAAGPPPGVALGGLVPGGDGKPLTIVLDPGHGGVDPGAVRDGIAEKDVVLAFAKELAAALAATGRFHPVLTRDADVFLPLADRSALAAALGARAFVSIHVNAIEDDRARGGILFTLSEAGSSSAARERAAVENRADARAGLPLAAPADPVGELLGGLRRAEAQARSIELARALAGALGPATGGGTQAPRQSANFQVRRGAEVPAALLELGFLSNASDRANLVSPEWRAEAARGVAAALDAWAAAEGPLTRK